MNKHTGDAGKFPECNDFVTQLSYAHISSVRIVHNEMYNINRYRCMRTHLNQRVTIVSNWIKQKGKDQFYQFEKYINHQHTVLIIFVMTQIIICIYDNGTFQKSHSIDRISL